GRARAPGRPGGGVADGKAFRSGAHEYGGQPAHRAVSTVNHRTPDRETVGTAAPRVDRRALSDVARSRSTRPQGNSRVPKRYEEGRSARFVAGGGGEDQQIGASGISGNS